MGLSGEERKWGMEVRDVECMKRGKVEEESVREGWWVVRCVRRDEFGEWVK